MYSYAVKVRAESYLWGSAGLNTSLEWPLLLIINNDPLGDPIEVGSEATPASRTIHGTLQAGECWTVPLHGLRGVFATCSTDTTILCTILVPNIGRTT